MLVNERPTKAFLAQFFIASSLVAGSVLVMALWLALALLALNHVLEPWVNSGILLFGIGFVAVAAAIGVPGVIWSSGLAASLSTSWAGRAMLLARIGTFNLVLGGVIALGIRILA